MHSETFILTGADINQMLDQSPKIEQTLSDLLSYQVFVNAYSTTEGLEVQIQSKNKEIKMRQFMVSKLKKSLITLNIAFDSIKNKNAEAHEEHSKSDFRRVFINLLVGSMVWGLIVCVLKACYYYFFSSFPDNLLVNFAWTFVITTSVSFVWFIVSTIMGD